MGLPVTQHFTTEEFDCHDGSPYPVEQRDDEDPGQRTWFESRLVPLCQTLEIVRAAAGGDAMKIDSGYRTLAYDQRLYDKHVAESGDDGLVAKATSSQHPKGRAADVTHSKLSPLALFNLIMSLYAAGKLPALGGCGLYKTFVHIDCRPKSGHLAIWGGTRPSNVA